MLRRWLELLHGTPFCNPLETGLNIVTLVIILGHGTVCFADKVRHFRHSMKLLASALTNVLKLAEKLRQRGESGQLESLRISRRTIFDGMQRQVKEEASLNIWQGVADGVLLQAENKMCTTRRDGLGNDANTHTQSKFYGGLGRVPVAPGTSRTVMSSDLPRPAMIFVGATMHAFSLWLSQKSGTFILSHKAISVAIARSHFRHSNTEVAPQSIWRINKGY